MSLPSELQEIERQIDAAERDAQELVAGLSEGLGNWRVDSQSWSVAECLDHLATTNRAYIAAMLEPAIRARQGGRMHHRPARPGWAGAWFLRSIEPPVKRRFKAPRIIQPRTSPALADALASFQAAQREVCIFLNAQADLDLAGIRFPNPFIPGVRFSLATGLHVIPAHERRHLWQAWSVRKAAESALH